MSNIKLFESKEIRSRWDAEAEKWYLSIVNIFQLFQKEYQTVTNCHALKMLVQIPIPQLS